MMDVGMLQYDRRIGSVKAAVSSYRERILEANYKSMKKSQENYSKKHNTKTIENQQGKRDGYWSGEIGKFGESVTAETEVELSNAKKTAKYLIQRIEQTNSRAKGHIWDLEKLNMAKRREEEWDTGNSQYADVMRELESIKLELSKLNMDMASVLEEKSRAEKETEDSLSKIQSLSSLLEELDKKIEMINEDQVLAELAIIEAINELEETEAWRRENSEKYQAAREEISEKTCNLIQEIEGAKGLETELATSISDINVLECEVQKFKEMEKVVETNESVCQIEPDLQEGEEKEEQLGLVHMLDSVSKELEDAKKTLTSIKEDSFQLMESMDIIREERKHVAEETAQVKKKEERTNKAIQNLNSKLLIAKVKLEAASAAEEKAKSAISNLMLKLEHLKPEVEATKKNYSMIQKEIEIIKAEVQKNENNKALAEERFQAAVQDLKAAKTSEAIALKNLQALIENTMKNRASTSQHSSTITISKLEYEYLTGHAAGAKEISDKKVAASQAWVEALKASELEILIKAELLQREIEKSRLEEERKINATEQLMNENEVIENEFEKWRQSMELKKYRPEPQLPTPSKATNRSARTTPSHPSKATNRSAKTAPSLPSKATNRSYRMKPGKRAKARGSASPAFLETPRSTPFIVRKKRKVLPNLTKFFKGRSA